MMVATLLLAIVWDLALGEPRRVHPVRAMGWLIHRLGRLRGRASGLGARVEGAVTVAVGVFVAVAVGGLGANLPRRLPGPLAVLAGAAWLKPTFSIRPLLEAGSVVRRALEFRRPEENVRLLGALDSLECST